MAVRLLTKINDRVNMKMKFFIKKKNMENQKENCEPISLRLSQIYREELLQVNTQMIVTSETI